MEAKEAQAPVGPELPQYGIAVNKDHQLWLTIQFGAAFHQVYLCEVTDYEDVAREIHKQIMEAGRQARRDKSGLVVAGGNHDATLRQAQGRKPGR